ncbi:hypothetical protein [Kangiella spongicola]|uniref:Uncharacterized protein n=1 Tax=Kangiella spongicola TaxID=796379 RepID=A0A318D4K8_9GAMM|nr:hypothetical protein [Kangiella spongicola]PXF64190.1 hypothetical protein DL796_03375 [Kangiella spongicola]
MKLIITFIFSLSFFNTALAYEIDCRDSSLSSLDKVESDIENIIESVRKKNAVLPQKEMKVRVSEALEDYFNKCLRDSLSNEELPKYSNLQLSKYYLNIDTIHFYKGTKELAKVLNNIVLEQVKREGVETNKAKLLTLEGILIQSRMFKDREVLVKKFPQIKFSGLQFIDSTNKLNKKRALSIADYSNRLMIDSIVLPKGGYVVVVSHPLCHFSQNARSFIRKNKNIYDVMDDKSLWLIPNSRRMYVDKVAEANLNEEKLPYVYAYSNDDWSEIDYWGTPAFYFYLNRELIFRFTGWPQEGNKDRLVEGLKKVGLL